MSWAQAFHHRRPNISVAPVPTPDDSVSSSGDMSNEVPREFLVGLVPEAHTQPCFQWGFDPLNAGMASQPSLSHRQGHYFGGQPAQEAHHGYVYVDEDEPAFVSASRWEQERRLSACLHSLQHIHQTLRLQHHESQKHVSNTEHLISQTSWDLFFQSPQDFIRHELRDIQSNQAQLDDVPALPPTQFPSGPSETWRLTLRNLQVLRDDEKMERYRTERLEKTMEYVAGMMEMAAREQAVVLSGGDLVVDQQHRRAVNRSWRRYGQQWTWQPQQQNGLSGDESDDDDDDDDDEDGKSDTPSASSKTRNKPAVATAPSGKSSTTSSTFLNWPLPATPLPHHEPHEEADAEDEECEEEAMTDNDTTTTTTSTSTTTSEEEGNNSSIKAKEQHLKGSNPVEETELKEEQTYVDAGETPRENERMRAATEALLGLSAQEVVMVWRAVEALKGLAS